VWPLCLHLKGKERRGKLRIENVKKKKWEGERRGRSEEGGSEERRERENKVKEGRETRSYLRS
jgi:hypothetical protein